MSTLRGAHLYVFMSSQYVLPLQKYKNLEGTVYRWHGLSLAMLMHLKCMHDLCSFMMHISTYYNVISYYNHVL
jgi:hypothetical protein